MTHREDFMHWWKDDEERAKCFLNQAVGAYVSSFPARVLPMLCELIDEEICKLPSSTDSDLSVPGIAEQGDPAVGSEEGGVSKACSNCGYWDVGTCQRYPPQLWTDGDSQPTTDREAWCGEWGPRFPKYD